MKPLKIGTPWGWLPLFLLLLITLPAGSPAQADSGIRKIPQIDLKVRSVGGAPQMEPLTLSVAVDNKKQIRFGWDAGAGKPLRVTLDAESMTTADEGTMSLKLRASLELPDGRLIQSSRQDRVQQRATILFELYRLEGKPVTLAVEATVGETWRAAGAPTVGQPVRFEVEILFVDGDSEVSVERNQLNTFEGQSVRYELAGRDDPSESSLTLRLTPIRIIGDLVEVRVQLSGKLPSRDADDGAHNDELNVVASDENVIVNRGSSTPVDITVGEPPIGYRFRISPQY